MNDKKRRIFSDFSYEKCRNLLLTAIVCYSIINTIAILKFGAVADDFAAYWSAGLIADEKGFSQIYELDNLRAVYSNEIKAQGYTFETDNMTYSVPYLPIFVLPFQLFSRVDLFTSYWLWNLINFVTLVGYLVFFLKSINTQNEIEINYLYLLVLMSFSFPVIKNLTSGNVNVFLLICTGEFLRNAVKNRPFLSGLWLGGLLLKPPVLILVIPIFLMMRYWNVLKGFLVSSGVILLGSLLLSGCNGMKSLLDLWIKYPADTFSNTAPGLMINWRMIGYTLDHQFNLSIGWFISGLGILLTILAVYLLTKQMSQFGSPSWVVAVLGVFSATLAITWHSLFYMAMVLIPFLLYISAHKLLQKETIFLWAIVPQVVIFGMDILGLLDILTTKIGVIDYKWMVVTFTGFIMNLIILYATINYKKGF